MSKTRTFVAIAASSAMRQRAKAAISQLRSSADNVKWVEPENLHWTLQFLGDVGDAQIVEVCRQVAQVAKQQEQFAITANGIGAFPSVERPRALWLRAEQGADLLCSLQDTIEESLSELGFRGERRRFVPHLTLGRIGQGSHGGAALTQKIAAMTDFEGGSMLANQVTVFGSELQRSGPTYHILARAPLAAQG